MPTYSIDFGAQLANVANFVVTDGLDDPESPRVVLYLSLLSTEISLKAMLEKAGKPVHEIRERSHNLAELLEDLGKIEIVPDTQHFASQLRAISIKQDEAEITVGKVIEAEKDGASSYPSDVRYGNRLLHYSPSVVAQMAFVVADFARRHWHTLRVVP